MFEALKIPAPVTRSDVPATLEKLEGELAKYRELVKVWEKKRDDGTLLAEFEEKQKEQAQVSEKNSPAKEEAPVDPVAAPVVEQLEQVAVEA